MQPRLSFTGRIASFSFRRKWYVLAAWLLLIVVAGATASGLSKVLTNDQKDLSNSDSAQATRLIKQHFGERPLTELVVTRSDSATVDDPTFRQTVANLATTLRNTPGVAQAVTYAQAGDPSMVSADRHAALTSITLNGNTDQAEKMVGGVITAVKNAPRPQGYTLNLTGESSANHELNKISDKDMSKAERTGLPIALAVVVLAFGSVIAGIIPLLLAFAAIVPATGSMVLVGHAFELSTLVTSIISMIGLAVGIDYSLFIIGRYREELGRGHTPAEAMGIAADSSGRAVFFSGVTVLLALGGMLFNRTNIFVSIGVGAMAVVVFAVLASLTLLPAFLGILGRKVNWLRIPYLGRANFGHRLWGAVTHAVQARPVVFVVASAGLLLAAAFPLTQIDLGSAGFDTLPKNTDTYRGIMALQRDFAVGRTQPVQLFVAGNPSSPEIQGAVARLQAEVQQRSDLQWLGAKPDAAGTALLIELAPQSLDTDAASKALVHDLRSSLIPQAFKGTGATVHVGGGLPIYEDVKGSMEGTMPIVFAFVLGLSFLLLLMVFRSVVIPAKAIVMNLLSVGAAYGLLVAVFQKGFLASQLGFQQTKQIEFWLPLFLFSILFGLSMDYHVFLLSRIKEEFDRTGDNRRAVRIGVQGTAGMITSAAIIMVAVFFAFSRGSLVGLQQVGFGLAVAVFLDATIIRSILVPASMQLLGKYNWWMPTWLNWLPKISVEGSAAIEADAEPAYTLSAAD